MQTRILLKLCSVLLFCCCLYGCSTVYNPATGRQEFIMISTDSEVAMGKNIHQQIRKEFGLLNDRQIVRRVQQIGQSLARVSDRQDYLYNFYIVDKKEVNAFTTPGGNIYVHKGLVDKMQSDAQLAAVLAHEIGHCAARHTVKKFQAAMGYNLITALVFSQVDKSGSASQAARLASNTAMNLIFSAYGRSDEHEADKLGIKYMRLAGFDLNGMIEILQILKKESKGSNTPLMLRTHPYLDDRIANVQKEI